MIGNSQLAYMSAVNELESTQKDDFELDDIFDYALSTVVDFGVTAVNSIPSFLSFGAIEPDLETSEIMHWLNEDAGDFYDQNKELVQLSSFVGGIFVPGMLAAKSMKWARQGRTWIGKTDSAIQQSEAKAHQFLKTKGASSEEFNAARSQMRWDTVKYGVAEGLVYETEFAALMNQHEYLDNDYDLTDYAIGAALGGLVGPLRLIQQEKKFRAAAQTAQSEFRGQEAFTVPIALTGEDAGQTLAYKGHQYNNFSTQDVSKFSTEDAELHKIAGWKHINDQSKHILSMAKDDAALRERINYTVDKGGVPKPRGLDYEDMLEAPVDDIIIRMNNTNPSVFPGVDKLKQFNAENPMLASMDSVFHVTDDGVMEASSGANAYAVLAGKEAKGLGRDAGATMQEIPEVFDVHLGEVVINGKVSSTDKRWLADYLRLPQVASNPIKFTGETAQLKPNASAIKQEAALEELISIGTHNNFTPYSKIAEQLSGTSSRAGVINPHLGEVILSEAEAISSAGLSSYPNLALDVRAMAGRGRNHKPFQQSVALTDKSYLDAQVAMGRAASKPTIQIASEADILPDLDAALITFAPKKFPKIEVRGSETKFESREEVATWVWEKKQNLVREGRAADASIPQIAVATNLPIKTVETILAANGSKLPFDEALPLMRYRKNQPELYAKQAPIQLEGKLPHYGQVDEIAVSSLHDASTMDAMEQSTIRGIIDATSIPALTEFMNEIAFSPIMKVIRDQLPKALTSISPVAHTLTSRDQALRGLGDLGEMITTIGQKTLTYVNKHYKEIETTIAPSASAVRQDAASRTQFSLFRQALHGIAIEDATKLVYDPALGKVVTDVAEDGTATYMKYKDSGQDIQFTPQMQGFMEAWLPVQGEMLGLHNASRRMHGLPESQGAGIWLPYSELHKDFVAYKVSKTGENVEIITGRNAKDLKAQVVEAQHTLGATHDIILKSEDSIQWNQLHRYAELEDFKIADISMKKQGITSGNVAPGSTDLDNLFESIRSDVMSKYRRIARASNSTIHDSLDFFAQRELAKSGGGKGTLAQKVQRQVSVPELVSGTLLNQSMMHAAPILDMPNNLATVAVNTIAEKFGVAKASVRGMDHEKEYTKLTEELMEAGVPMPWRDTETYVAALKRAEVKDVALHRVQQAQSVMVMFNLRLLEASHAAVTTLSLPVILQGELAHTMGKGGRYPMKHMAESMQFWKGNSAEAIALRELAERNQYTKPMVAETSAMLEDFHSSTDFWHKHKKTLDFMSKPSDWSEAFVREQAFANGYMLAKAKNPTADMEVLAANAYAFTSRTMGNYVPRQRPTMFQGTFGAMVGLYQTFMLTMGQNMYRYLEAGDAKAMRNLWAGQASMFGFESLPGFQQFNQVLGAKFSDDHDDIRTSIYNVFGSDEEQSGSAAEYLLYGAPSAMFGAGIYTRGTIDPRSPLSLTGEGGMTFKPAIFDAAIQTGELIYNLAEGATTATGTKDLGKSILQGFAAQSLWRPVARYSEVAMGESFDRQGKVISTEQEVMAPSALLSRAIGARPLKEQALRNLRFANTYYNSIDTDRRAMITKKLRRVLTEDPDINQTSGLYTEYMGKRGATARGWRQIYNDAAMSVDTPYANRLLDTTKNQSAIQEVVDGYAN